MSVAGDVIVDVVDWTISHSNGYTRSGQVDTSSNLQVFHLEIARIPANTLPYTITLTATGFDSGGNPTANCAVTETFLVSAGAPTTVPVTPICTRIPGATGTVEITGNGADFCPKIDEVTAAVVQDGAGYLLDVVATDEDGGTIEYSWSATGGTFDDASVASPTFQCAAGAPGAPVTETITIQVTQLGIPAAECADTQQLGLDCTGVYPGQGVACNGSSPGLVLDGLDWAGSQLSGTDSQLRNACINEATNQYLDQGCLLSTTFNTRCDNALTDLQCTACLAEAADSAACTACGDVLRSTFANGLGGCPTYSVTACVI